MRYLSYLLLLITSLLSPLSADSILVRLPTEASLIPVHVAPVTGQSFSHSYFSKLHQVLSFDLSYNGSTEVSADSTNAYYVITCRVSNNSLSATILSVNNGYTQSIDGIPLTGELANDRQQIHRLSDAIHRALFGKAGIASNRILYTVKVEGRRGGQREWVSEVWECDYDGQNARQITHDQALCVNPVYIPPKPGYSSSGGFLYVSYKTGQPKIYVGRLSDGRTRRFSMLPGNQLMPSISFQRDKVVFISDATSNPDVFMQPFNPDVGSMGKPQQIFAARHATQGSPAVHPNGKQIAFVSNKDGSAKIYLMDIPRPGTSVNALRPQVLTTLNRENTAPSWSPDGTKLAYCARSGSNRQIWIYDVATGTERQLTQGPGNKENPTWAPDSLHLVFNSADDKSSELYLVNLNQPTAVKITSGVGEKRFPSWEPSAG